MASRKSSVRTPGRIVPAFSSALSSRPAARATGTGAGFAGSPGALVASRSASDRPALVEANRPRWSIHARSACSGPRQRSSNSSALSATFRKHPSSAALVLLCSNCAECREPDAERRMLGAEHGPAARTERRMPGTPPAQAPPGGLSKVPRVIGQPHRCAPVRVVRHRRQRRRSQLHPDQRLGRRAQRHPHQRPQRADVRDHQHRSPGVPRQRHVPRRRGRPAAPRWPRPAATRPPAATDPSRRCRRTASPASAASHRAAAAGVSSACRCRPVGRAPSSPAGYLLPSAKWSRTESVRFSTSTPCQYSMRSGLASHASNGAVRFGRSSCSTDIGHIDSGFFSNRS